MIIRSRWVRGIALAAMCLLFPATAGAQTSAIPPAAGAVNQAAVTASVPTAEVFAGLAFWNEEGTVGGAHFSIAFRTGRHFALVGDLAFYEEDFRTQTIMGGVRVYGPAQRVSLFAQFLVGNAPLDDFALQPGVGVDVQLGKHVAVRAGLDIKISADDGSTYIGTRFSTGVVIQLGRK